MLLYLHLLQQLLPQLITVTLFFHMILPHNRDKMCKKIIIHGMVKLEAIFMEETMMQVILQKDMLLLMENVPNIKKHNKKLYSTTGIKSQKHTNKHFLTFVLQVIEQHSVMISKSKLHHQLITLKEQTVEVVQLGNIHEYLPCIEGQSIKDTLIQMSISDRIMSPYGHFILKYDYYIFLLIFIFH